MNDCKPQINQTKTEISEVHLQVLKRATKRRWWVSQQLRRRASAHALFFFPSKKKKNSKARKLDTSKSNAPPKGVRSRGQKKKKKICSQSNFFRSRLGSREFMKTYQLYTQSGKWKSICIIIFDMCYENFGVTFFGCLLDIGATSTPSNGFFK